MGGNDHSVKVLERKLVLLNSLRNTKMLAAVVLYGEAFNYVCIGGVRGHFGLFGKQYTFGSLIMPDQKSFRLGPTYTMYITRIPKLIFTSPRLD